MILQGHMIFLELKCVQLATISHERDQQKLVEKFSWMISKVKSCRSVDFTAISEFVKAHFVQFLTLIDQNQRRKFETDQHRTKVMLEKIFLNCICFIHRLFQRCLWTPTTKKGESTSVHIFEKQLSVFLFATGKN